MKKFIDGVEFDMTQTEIAEYYALMNAGRAGDARDKRNSLLAQTDWSQAADVPASLKANYTVYRQALRDVPSQSGFPDNIVWPVPPT